MTTPTTATPPITADHLGDALVALRERGPLVQCLTNVVVTNWTANVLLAAGAAKLPQPGRSKYPYPRCCQRQRRKRYKRSLNRQRPPPRQFREASTAKFALARPAPRGP